MIEPSMNDTNPSGPDFKKLGGLLPVVVQDAHNSEVLMHAYMNEEAYAQTSATGYAVYFSRSRNQLWRKGETSGHRQQVHAVFLDCDLDTILLKVTQEGGACHTGFRTCFFQQVTPEGIVQVGKPVFDPNEIYKK